MTKDDWIASQALTEAIGSYRATIEFNPDLHPTRLSLAQALYGAYLRGIEPRDREAAILKRVIESEPRFETAWQGLAALLRETGRRAELDRLSEYYRNRLR